jgi:hypothetical protein
MRRLILALMVIGAMLAAKPAAAWETEQAPCDFVTGGGFIVGSASPPSSLRTGVHGNFGVGGGVKNGAWWGHLEYNDHGTNPPLQVHGTSVLSYIYIDAQTRYIQGTCTVNGASGFTYEVKVTDKGEPGRDNDEFSIRVFAAGGAAIYAAGAWSGDGPIRGGNIQLHKGNASNTPPAGFTCQGSGSGSSTPPPPPSTVTRYEESSPSVVFTGTWYPVSRPDVSGGTCQKGEEPGGRATFTFTGTGISWIGFNGPVTGFARVYLDGALVATVDTYSPTEKAQSVDFTKSGLAPGTHTIAIEATGTYNPSSCCAWIAVDAFDVAS